MKKVIGIVPASKLTPDKSGMSDYYWLGNNYIKRTIEAGATPIGLAPCDNWLEESSLDLCDGFLVQGGEEFYPYHFQVIHHAINKGKKYLGICLGSQLIYVYFKIKSIVEEQGYTGDLVKAICDYYAKLPSDFTFQKRIDGHRNVVPPRGEEDKAKHNVCVLPNTLMHKVVGCDEIRLCSYHYLCTPPEQELVTINSWSALGDNVVEGVEYSNHILGIQGHPEADDMLPKFFNFLAKD